MAVSRSQIRSRRLAETSAGCSTDADVQRKIVCSVLHALPDLIIVSFESPEKQIFQGALLKISNSSPFEGFHERLKEDNPRDYFDENFHTLNKRHTYFQQRDAPARGIQPPSKKLGVRLRARQVLCNNCKNVCTESGETVRPKAKVETSTRHEQAVSTTALSATTVIRPKGKRRSASPTTAASESAKVGLVPKIRRVDPVEAEKFSTPRFSPPAPSKYAGKKSKSSTPEPEENSSRTTRQSQPQNEPQETRPTQQQPLKIRFANFGKLKLESSPHKSDNEHSSDDVTAENDEPSKSGKWRMPERASMRNKLEENGRNLRKKRSAVGSMEDLWDETVFGANSPAQSTSSNFVEPAPPPPLPASKETDSGHSKRSTPVLKISFGTLGQGTVLKIPSKLNGPSVQETEENDENFCSPSVEKSPSSFWSNRSPRYVAKETTPTAKAAKKALKRARKEAQKRAVYGGLSPAAYHLRSSPGGATIASSPSASSFGNWSPMRLGAAASAASPARNPIYVGGVSPAYPFPASADSTASMGPPKSKPKKHKRKKHKRKKADSETPELSDESTSSNGLETEPGGIEKFFCGNVVWGKTKDDIWWPAKVVRVVKSDATPMQIEVTWYSNLDSNSSSVLDFEHVRSFNEFYQECFEASTPNQTFESAVKLASEEVVSVSNVGPEELLTSKTSLRTIGCIS